MHYKTLWLQIPNYVEKIETQKRYNNRFLRERGMPSNPKMEYRVFLCIFQKNLAIGTLGLKEMGKFLWEGREKGLPSWLSQFSKTKLRQPTGQTFYPTFPKEFFHFLQTLGSHAIAIFDFGKTKIEWKWNGRK